MSILDAVIHESLPNKHPSASVIWMHGLGANGYDFLDALPLLGLQPELNIRFIFPHAPLLSITANAGMVMPAWYDIRSWDLGAMPDLKGMLLSVGQIEQWIEHEKNQGILLDKILLVGFSQGGVIALLTALSSQYTIGGVAGLSTYLPVSTPDISEWVRPYQSTRHALPIFMAHGALDPIVPYFVGEKSKNYLKQLGFSPDWHTYSMVHALCHEEMTALGMWMNKQLFSQGRDEKK